MPVRRRTSQAEKGSLLVEVRRAASLKIGEVLKHELQIPQDLPPEIRSLLRQLYNVSNSEPQST